MTEKCYCYFCENKTGEFDGSGKETARSIAHREWQGIVLKESKPTPATKPTRTAPKTVNLVEAYKSLGLSEAQAKLAAGVEKAVVSGSADSLVESFKALGMDQKTAELAARKPN